MQCLFSYHWSKNNLWTIWPQVYWLVWIVHKKHRSVSDQRKKFFSLQFVRPIFSLFCPSVSFIPCFFFTEEATCDFPIIHHTKNRLWGFPRRGVGAGRLFHPFSKMIFSRPLIRDQWWRQKTAEWWGVREPVWGNPARRHLGHRNDTPGEQSQIYYPSNKKVNFYLVL